MSQVAGAGYGLFAKVDIRSGDRVCLYTGKCTKSALGNEGGKYMLSCQWFNDGSSEWEQWHIDSYVREDECCGPFYQRRTQYSVYQ